MQKSTDAKVTAPFDQCSFGELKIFQNHVYIHFGGGGGPDGLLTTGHGVGSAQLVSALFLCFSPQIGIPVHLSNQQNPWRETFANRPKVCLFDPQV